MITGVRGYHQLDGFSCGTAAAATVVRAYTGELEFPDWREIVRSTRPHQDTGTPTRRLKAAITACGFGFTTSRGLKKAAAKRTILAGDMLVTTVRMPGQRDDATHWVVIVGYSEDSLLVVNCTGLPLFSKRWISWEDLERRRSPNEVSVHVKTGLTDWVSDRLVRTPRIRK